MQNDNPETSLVYKRKEPDINILRDAYETTTTDLGPYFQECAQSYEDRRNWWPGKSRDQRKAGANAFPWKGASDIEAHVIDSRINSYVSMMMNALMKANIRATPVETGDIGRAKVVSSFLKWMIASYIPRFKKETELSANYMLERGIAITYVGWQREEQSYLQAISLEQLAQIDPNLAQRVLDGTADDELIAMLRSVYPSVSDKRAKRALKELRKNGVAEIPVTRLQVNRPIIESLAPDGDFFFPAYVSDPQRAPYCFWRTFYSAQELKSKVTGAGWNEDWVDYLITHNPQNVRSIGPGANNLGVTTQNLLGIGVTTQESEDLYEVVYAYQKLIDEEDGSVGIYCTIFSPSLTVETGDEVTPYAKFELLNGVEEYPVVVTRLFNESKRLYDTTNFPALLRGSQMQVKVERDSRIDRNSMATLPPIMHPVGNPPGDWKPGGFIPYRRQGEFQFGPTPQYNMGSAEMEKTMLMVADELVGLNPERVDSVDMRQYFVSRLLTHAQEVIKMAFKAYQRFGPEQVFFRVTGSPDPMRFDRGNPDESFDIVIGYDVLSSDPETQENKLNALVSLFQLDRNGRINVDSFIELAANAIDPIMADYVLQPAEAASQQIVKHVTDDLTKIFSGIEMPARPNGAQIALQVIQQYASQPDIAQRLQQDEAFRARLEKYNSQYIFMQQQAQNAQIGRIGTQPAAMGAVQTQAI
jgi:hypothetical protein